MATLTNLSAGNLALKGAGTDYNFINRFFATKAEADAALADNSWAPVAGRLNAALTGDQGLLIYNENTQALDVADAATRAYVDTKLAALTGDAPELLNTLGEISDALNDDPDFFEEVIPCKECGIDSAFYVQGPCYLLQLDYERNIMHEVFCSHRCKCKSA